MSIDPGKIYEIWRECAHTPDANHEDLQRISGYKQTAAMQKYFRKIGIPVHVNRLGKLWTTWDAITDTLSGRPQKTGDSKVRVDAF